MNIVQGSVVRRPDNAIHRIVIFSSMPVYLVFLQVAKKNLQLARRGPNLPTSLEACKLRQGTGHQNIFLSCVSYYSPVKSL